MPCKPRTGICFENIGVENKWAAMLNVFFLLQIILAWISVPNITMLAMKHLDSPSLLSPCTKEKERENISGEGFEQLIRIPLYYQTDSFPVLNWSPVPWSFMLHGLDMGSLEKMK